MRRGGNEDGPEEVDHDLAYELRVPLDQERRPDRGVLVRIGLEGAAGAIEPRLQPREEDPQQDEPSGNRCEPAGPIELPLEWDDLIDGVDGSRDHLIVQSD